MGSPEDAHDRRTRSVIGVDVGGTKTLAVRVPFDSGSGTPVALDRERVGSDALADSAIEQIERSIQALIDRCAQVGDLPPEAIGLGMAGFISREGIAISSPNTPGLVGVDVPGRLRSRFGVPVVVDNDANCVAIAARREFAPEVETMLAVTLGTGIGGGIITGGRLLRGANGFAGEPGHMVIDPDGPQCPCGQRGCWERYASGSGLGWLARNAAAAGHADSLIAAAGTLEQISGEHVTDLMEHGDPAATAVFGEFAGYVTLGIANLIMLLDPEVVVIGGGLAAEGEVLSALVRTDLERRFPAASRHRHLTLLVAPEGPEAGALGAAILAVDAIS